MIPKKENQKPNGGVERRRTRRRPILDTFSLFVVLPKKGMHRLQVHDVSDLGIGFMFDTEGEEAADFPAKIGDMLELHFYLNQSLYLPLYVQIARIELADEMRRIGGEFIKKEGKGHAALLAFVQMLDSIADVAQIDSR